jgi:hypothetical protein
MSNGVERIGEILTRVLDTGRTSTCLLCGCGAAVLGAFVQDLPRVDRPEARCRLVFYGLCNVCMADQPASAERAEKILEYSGWAGASQCAHS